MTEALSLHLAGVEKLQADLQLLAQAAQRSLEIRNALFGLLDGLGEAAWVDIQSTATSTANELWVEAKLCDRLAGFVAALRAGDVDAL